MRRGQAPLTLLGLLLALYLLAPFAAGLARLGAADWSGVDLPALAHATRVSITSASLATALVALGGIPLGYRLAHARGRAAGLLGFLVQLPLALPPLASGVLLLFLLGYASPLGRLTGGALTDSFAGIVLAEAFVAAPFLIVAARSAFAAMDPQLEAVAATLGHRPGAVFRRVALPVAGRAILAGALLAWLRAFGEFGATVMVAYHPYSLPVLTYVAFGSEGLPAMLPILLPTLVAAVTVMALSQLVLPRRAAPAAHAPPRRPLLPPAIPPPSAPAAPRAPASLEIAARRRLDGFSLDVGWRTGARRLAILGASGSGKSTTLRILAGLDRQPGDVLALCGQDLACLPPHARGVAFVPQDYALMPHLTLARQVRFAADSEPALAARWTARLGLSGLEQRRPHALSLGQQQRVALARALSRRHAGLLLLDEPFAALDTALRRQLRRELLAVQAEAELTTILVTHDPDEAMLLADELLLLADGCVLQSGPVATLFARPVSEAAARLLGAEAIGRATAVPGGLDLGGPVLPLPDSPGPAGFPPGTGLGWSVRPHQLRLAPSGPGAGLPATILRRGPLRDGQREVVVRLGRSVLTLPALPSCPPEGECHAELDPEALQIWPLDGG